MLQAPYLKAEVCSVSKPALCPIKRPPVVHRPFAAFSLNSVAPQNSISRCKRIVARGFFDSVFKPGKSHAPELVRLNTDDEGGLAQTSADLFGPLAVLLVGFHEHEVQAFRGIMLDMDADMVKRVGDRAVILSGMNAAEIGEIIGAYRDAGLPEPVWAAALAANWDRKISDLVHDIYGDHRYMMERERNAGI
ncbi:MAG: hypothetical protein FRX49_06495 [Trebouxia sp. A1-2]|nr:MAG: hypothetical protein FRX49_06495 [Trebouxia sp. A1-2]